MCPAYSTSRRTYTYFAIRDGWSVEAADGLEAALPADNGSLNRPIFDTVINGKTVIGSIVGTRNDLAEVFNLHAAGRIPARVVFQL